MNINICTISVAPASYFMTLYYVESFRIAAVTLKINQGRWKFQYFTEPIALVIQRNYVSIMHHFQDITFMN